MSRLLLVVLSAFLAGCRGKLESPPEIGSERSESESTELVFLLDDHEHALDGSQSFSARGLLEGKPVGFGVQLGTWMENGPGYVNMSTWESRGRIVSRGTESDQLLHHIDLLYRAGVPAPRMAASVDCQFFCLWASPGKLDGDPAKLLVLIPGTESTPDAEVWLEVRPEENRVILREKEPRFRKPLIEALKERPVTDDASLEMSEE